MQGTQVGEFEELVLLNIAFLCDEAYSVAVMEELALKTGRPVALGVVHPTGQRLEEKELLQLWFGQATRERVVGRKRLFRVATSVGRALTEARGVRSELWAGIPKAAYGGGWV